MTGIMKSYGRDNTMKAFLISWKSDASN